MHCTSPRHRRHQGVSRPVVALGATLAAGAAVCAALVVGGCAAPERAADEPTTRAARLGDVSGRLILTLCDADMVATAFYNSLLGPRDPGARDVLTILELPLREPETPWGQSEVSNSAYGPPNALSVTPDARYAFAVETRGPAPDGATTVDELPTGTILTAVDLETPTRPRLLGTAYVGEGPQAVDVHPDGDVVAVVTQTPRQQIVMVPFRDGAMSEGLPWPLFGLDDDEAAPSCIVWHPSGRYFAVTLPRRDEVIFYEFTRDDGAGSMALARWGEPVRVGKFPYSGAFTPDGRHFITTDLKWGPDVEGFFVGAPEGQLSVIRLSDVETERPGDDGQPRRVRHRVVSRVGVGVSPEGLAISPDGRAVVTANLRRSFLPEGDPRLTRGGSLTLLSFDSSTGRLRVVNEYPMDGMPEGLAFDAAGNFVVASLFRSFDPAVVDGELAFWRLRRDPLRLEEADFRVGVGKGPHSVLIVR